MLLALAIFLLSAAALTLEILLMRLFSIVEWHHLAWMVISLALLGYGAGGTFVAIFRRRLLRHLRASLIALAALTALAVPAAVTLIPFVRFNSLELVWDPRQMLRLAAMYLLLGVPFFTIASFMGTILTARRGAVARLYRADLLGAGVGAASAIAILFVLDVAGALRVVSAMASAAAILVALASRGRTRVAGAALGMAALVASILWPASLLRIRMTPYKDLAQALRIRGATLLDERSGPMALLDVVGNETVPFRNAAGLSLAFPGEVPRQVAIFADGTLVTTVPATETGRIAPAYVDYLTGAAAYAACSIRGRRALVIGADVPAILDALGRGALSVDVIEPNSQLIRVIRETLRRHNALVADPRIVFHCADARAFLSTSRDRWRLIETTLPSGGGEAGLRESTLLTTEGLSLLMQRLEPGGLVSITGAVRLPPNEMLKLIMTVGAAGDALQIDTRRALAIVRSWSTATVVFGRDPLARTSIEALGRFCDERSFDLDFPRTGRGPLNVMDAPYLTEAAIAAAAGERGRQAFSARFKFDIDPATDSRPFFFHFFRWRALPELMAMRGRGGAPLIESAYLVAVAALAQAIAAAALLVVLPLALHARTRRGREEARRPMARMVVYFASIGTAFLFVEIALLQRFTLFLSHPLYAASVVLGSFLLFAGLGSGLARRLSARDVRARSLVLLGIAAGAALYVPALPRLFAIGPPSDALRIFAAVAAVAPVAVLMGIPFPLGISLFGGIHRGWIPWAWAVNGSASVISAVAATLLSIAAGADAVLLTASGLYVVALLALVKPRSSALASAAARSRAGFESGDRAAGAAARST